jgi:hypothetical protein
MVACLAYRPNLLAKAATDRETAEQSVLLRCSLTKTKQNAEIPGCCVPFCVDH